MSEFDAFNDENPPQNDSEADPAADFLAREQDELAGLQDDNFEVVPNPPSEENIVNDTSSPSPVPPQPEPVMMNGPSEDMVPQISVMKEEPEKIRIWKEQQQEMLKEKDEKEEEKKEELRASAKKELEEWYSRYNDQIEKSKANNRNAEKEYVAARDATVPGQEWERITTLCDFNPKSSRGTKDVSRMRSILLQLKQTPPVKA